jgi:hypothetical protein
VSRGSIEHKRGSSGQIGTGDPEANFSFDLLTDVKNRANESPLQERSNGEKLIRPGSGESDEAQLAYCSVLIRSCGCWERRCVSDGRGKGTH